MIENNPLLSSDPSERREIECAKPLGAGGPSTQDSAPARDSGDSAARALREGIELLDDSVVIYDRFGLITAWNTASTRLYGLAREQALGRSPADLIDCNGTFAPETLARRFAGGERWRGKLSRRTTGGLETIEVHWMLRRDDRGEPLEIIETGRCERRLDPADEAVQLAAYRYRNLYQSLAVAFWEIDFTQVGRRLKQLRADGVGDLVAHLTAHPEIVRELLDGEVVLDANPTAVRMFGAADLAQLTSVKTSRYWPDESIPDYIGCVTAVLNKRTSYVCETRLLALDGTPLDVLMTFALPDQAVKSGVSLLGIIDLADRNRAYRELQRSERRYRNLFGAMAVGFLELDFTGVDRLLAQFREQGVVDVAGHLRRHPDLMREALDGMVITLANEKAAELLRTSAAGDLNGAVTRFRTEESDRVLADSIHGRFHRSTMPPVETRFRAIDGSMVDVLFTVWAPPDRKPDESVLCGLVDITDRIAAQRMLEKVQGEFAHASRISTLGELAASIAHEVNQPLAAITANAQSSLRWLERPQPDLAESRLSAERIVEDAQRAAAVIARVRGMASAGEGARTVLSVNGVVEEAVMFLRHERQQQGVELTLELMPEEDMVMGDRIQLQQVFVNLAINAIQAMAGIDGRRVLTVRTRRRGKGLSIVFEDDGPGFERGTGQQLFESFFTTKASGMGIGLSVCRSIVESHGGSIVAENRAEGGARFQVTLPADAGQENEPLP